MRPTWIICGALAFGACDDGATPALTPDLAVDAAPMDAQIDAAQTDAAQIDARVDAADDATPIDATPPEDAALRVDSAPVDMRVVDMTPPDSAVADMAPLDMALPDMAPLDMGPPREDRCFDEIDNDDDGRVDCADPDCRPLAACFDHPEDCENGVDDNGDNWADCEDVLCLDVCPPEGDPPLDAAAIQARFDLVCTQCHAGAQPAALLDLTAFEETTIGVLSTQVAGLRIVPGDRQASYLWRKMAYSFRTFEGGGGEGMPPVDAQDASFVDRFGDWIDAL